MGYRVNHFHARGRARGITLAELLIASVIAAILAGLTVVALRQASSSRNRSRAREDAVSRVYAVSQLMARDVADVVRDQESAATMVRIIHGSMTGTDNAQDELLLFAHSRQPVRVNRDPDSGGHAEGGTYEVQYRLVADFGDTGTVWRRRDPIPDKVYDGGGVAVPIATGITSVRFEAFDGSNWVDEWDSDTDGMPFAVRITCRGQIADSTGTTVAQCVVALDRVPKPVFMAADDPNFNLFGDDGSNGDLFGDNPFGGSLDNQDNNNNGGGGSGGGFGSGGGR